jgi:LuxR family transcriptional regulator, positive regulator of biofilm formation
MPEFTFSEKKVVDLVITGASNREIAAILCVSLSAVAHHLTHIYQKTGLNNRIKLVLWLKNDKTIKPQSAYGGMN